MRSADRIATPRPRLRLVRDGHDDAVEEAAMGAIGEIGAAQEHITVAWARHAQATNRLDRAHRMAAALADALRRRDHGAAADIAQALPGVLAEAAELDRDTAAEWLERASAHLSEARLVAETLLLGGGPVQSCVAGPWDPRPAA